MIVRRELPEDADAVRSLFSTVLSDTFFDRLHADEAWMSALAFVALRGDGDVVGHVAATRGKIGSDPALALVPPSVDLTHRGHGVGQALMHSILGAAEALDEALIGLVAMPPEFYSQFGFHPAAGFGITPSVDAWQPYFLVRPLTAYDPSFAGTFHFPDPFL
jgi:putative acetyltransferase